MNELDGSRGSPRHSRLKDFIPNYDRKLDSHVVKSNFEVLTKSIFLRHQKHYRQTSLLIKVNILQISNCPKIYSKLLSAGVSTQVQARPWLKHVSLIFIFDNRQWSLIITSPTWQASDRSECAKESLPSRRGHRNIHLGLTGLVTILNIGILPQQHHHFIIDNGLSHGHDYHECKQDNRYFA